MSEYDAITHLCFVMEHLSSLKRVNLVLISDNRKSEELLLQEIKRVEKKAEGLRIIIGNTDRTNIDFPLVTFRRGSRPSKEVLGGSKGKVQKRHSSVRNNRRGK